MSINNLPPEVLAQITGWLGHRFFRKDVARLTVSKKWYALARPVLFQTLDLGAFSLHRLAQKIGKRAIDTVFSHVIEINLHLQGCDDWIPLAEGDGSFDQVQRIADNWTYRLSGDLYILGKTMQRFTKLRRISFTAWQEDSHGRFGVPQRPYLGEMAILGVVCAKNITSLDVDIGGTPFIREPWASNPHLCKRIRETLQGLRRLRIRSVFICPAILVAPTSTEERHSLENVIVNLSLSNMAASDTSYRYSSCCEQSSNDVLNLAESMELQAKELAAALAHPKIIRVISHTFPGLQTRAFDAITGRRYKLEDLKHWEADGEVIEESDTDSESEISDVDI
ncbi:hypothetical protein NLG97_g5292 [Lecanicillium saksenae]|uniref:Uncharacterized protein n=1 Tax=Lecanicillium saksenae TaxID=468837 RepID=A0ACC1QT26_9HYPO|nr:hypothetical protein NLG97_g5292 [Lecanicillium saksenae]